MKIAIIGTGNLGLSIAKGLIVNNSITTLYLTKRNPEALADWNKSKQVTVTSDNREAVKNSDILIFAVQPSQFEGILSEIKDLLNDHHVIISTITGFKIRTTNGKPLRIAITNATSTVLKKHIVNKLTVYR